jgi:Dolichyl-phosphate-mannose-protein mannosyltransferase
VRRHRKTLVVAVAANVLILGAFVWSRPGGTTTVRVRATGNAFEAYVDGKLWAHATSTAEPRGGVGFTLPPREAAAAYPGPTALRGVRVTAAGGGRVLLEDSFDESRGAWRRDSALVQRGGATWAPTGGTLSTGYRPWRDYVVEAHLSNVARAEILVRTQDNGDAIDFAFRPFRDFDSGFFVRRGRTLTALGAVGTVETDPVETARSIVAVALRPYPTVLLVFAAGLLAFGAAHLGTHRSPLAALASATAAAAHRVSVGLTLAAFGVLLAIEWIALERVPHVPDEIGYLFQAKIFASFRLYGHVPQLADHFAFPGTIVEDHGRWFSQYPFGHPLFLAFGELIHAPWVVPPVVGALTLYCVYRLGAHLHGPLTGLLAALLLLASPFFEMTASNFMSHNTASLCLVAGTLFFVRPGSRPRAGWFLSGLFLGLLFNIRPLTAAGVSVPFLLWTVLEWRRADDRRAFTVRAACLGAGAAVMLGAFVLYNLALTGSALKTPYAYAHSDVVGFSGPHTVAAGLMQTQTNLSLLVLVLNGWPLFVGLLLPLLPFLLGTLNRWDYFLLACVLSIAAAWTSYHGVFIMYGPRFWYEMVPFLMLLSARGVQRFVEAAGATADELTTHFRHRAVDVRPWAAVMAVAFVFGLVGNTFDGWVLGRRSLYPQMTFVPRDVGELRGFNHTDARLLRLAEARGVHRSVVFVRECPDWWCYGSVFWTNSPALEGDIVWARDLGRKSDAKLLAASFPGRSAYVADYNLRTIHSLRDGR